MKRILTAIITLFGILTLIFPTIVAGQNQVSTILSYIKTSQNTKELVRIIDGTKNTYLLPQGSCWSFSPDNTYFTESSDSRSDLIIRRVDSLEIVYQGVFRVEWQTCSMNWQPDSTLSITRSDNQSQFLYYRIVDNNLEPINYTSVLVQYPELPDWLKDTEDGYVLSSPNPNIYLYQRCNGHQTTRSGNSCAVDTDFIIYEVQQQTIKQILKGADANLIAKSVSPPFDSAGAAVWSETGRFLAYADQIHLPFNLSVYDIATNQYLNTNFAPVDINWQKKLQWSHVGDKLAIWIMQSVNEADPSTYRSLVFFDAVSQAFITASQGFNISTGLGYSGIWSPENATFALVDQSGVLFTVDSTTGTVTSLDSDVIKILNWTITIH